MTLNGEIFVKLLEPTVPAGHAVSTVEAGVKHQPRTVTGTLSRLPTMWEG